MRFTSKFKKSKNGLSNNCAYLSLISLILTCLFVSFVTSACSNQHKNAKSQIPQSQYENYAANVCTGLSQNADKIVQLTNSYVANLKNTIGLANSKAEAIKYLTQAAGQITNLINQIKILDPPNDQKVKLFRSKLINILETYNEAVSAAEQSIMFANPNDLNQFQQTVTQTGELVAKAGETESQEINSLEARSNPSPQLQKAFLTSAQCQNASNTTNS